MYNIFLQTLPVLLCVSETVTLLGVLATGIKYCSVIFDAKCQQRIQSILQRAGILSRAVVCLSVISWCIVFLRRVLWSAATSAWHLDIKVTARNASWLLLRRVTDHTEQQSFHWHIAEQMSSDITHSRQTTVRLCHRSFSVAWPHLWNCSIRPVPIWSFCPAVLLSFETFMFRWSRLWDSAALLILVHCRNSLPYLLTYIFFYLQQCIVLIATWCVCVCSFLLFRLFSRVVLCVCAARRQMVRPVSFSPVKTLYVDTVWSRRQFRSLDSRCALTFPARSTRKVAWKWSVFKSFRQLFGGVLWSPSPYILQLISNYIL